MKNVTKKYYRGTGWCRNSKRLAIYMRDNFSCMLCGKQCAAHELTLDHIIPHGCGGSNNENNLITACHTCNSTRRDEELINFVDYDTFYRIVKHVELMPVNRNLALRLLDRHNSPIIAAHHMIGELSC
jgi:hypothetical protein